MHSCNVNMIAITEIGIDVTFFLKIASGRTDRHARREHQGTTPEYRELLHVPPP